MHLIHPQDPAVIAALDLGHDPPYIQEELDTIRILVCIRARADFEAFSHLGKGLYNITIESSEVFDLSWWPHSPMLHKAQLSFCPIEDLSPLLRCPRVRFIQARGTMIKDLSPLFEMEYLDDIVLTGAPLTEEAYYEQLPRLKAWRAPKAKRAMDVTHCDEETWKLSCELQRRGLRATYGDYGEGARRVLSPGLLFSDTPDLSSFLVPPENLRRILDEASWDNLVSFMRLCYEAQVPFKKPNAPP